MIINNLLWIWVACWAVSILLFITKELFRYFYIDPKIKKDNSLPDDTKEQKLKSSKKNINDLFGLDKKTFLTLAGNMIIISLASLSFIETSNQNKETALINERTLQMFELENRPYISLKPTKFDENNKYISTEDNNQKPSFSIRFELKNTGRLHAKKLVLSNITIPSIRITKTGSNEVWETGPINASIPDLKSSLGSGESTKFTVYFEMGGKDIHGKDVEFEPGFADKLMDNTKSIPIEAVFSYNSDIDSSVNYKVSLSAIIKSDDVFILNQD